MRQRIYETGKRWNAFILAMVLLVLSVSPLQVQAQTTVIKPIEAIDFSDFSNWRSGAYYYTNGQYREDQYRICLNEYVTCQGKQYRAHITQVNFKLLVRELDQNKNFIRSCTLANGNEYTPSAKAVYLGISLYKVDGESSMSYEAYRTKFSQGFVAELKPISTDNSGSTSETVDSEDTSASEDTSSSSSTQVEYKNIENINLSDISNWRSGVYYYANGQYQENQYRICLKNYVTFVNKEYKVAVSEKVYKILIRELDENKKFLRSVTLSDGQSYQPGGQAKYLAVSLYKSDSETGMSYEVFRKKFAAGFKVAIKAVVEEEEEEEELIEWDEGNSDLSTSDSESGVYSILKKALLTTDSTDKDISQYSITSNEFYAEWKKVMEDCYLEYHTYGNVYPFPNAQNGKVKTFKFYNMDDGFAERLPKVKQAVKEFCDSVDDRMTDMEKILLAHEYVVSHTQYLRADQSASMAGGPLGTGYGVCGGYTDAMQVLLHYVDVETELVTSAQMNHAWLIACVDGAWYHIDPTWDDTNLGGNEIYTHRFFIRSDDEIANIDGYKHYGWIFYNGTRTCSSSKYTDWFVHSVPGMMYYYDGLWYYKDGNTNSIVCSDIQGNSRKVVVDGSQQNKIKVCGISGNVLTYTVGTEKKTISL